MTKEQQQPKINNMTLAESNNDRKNGGNIDCGNALKCISSRQKADRDRGNKAAK